MTLRRAGKGWDFHDDWKSTKKMLPQGEESDQDEVI